MSFPRKRESNFRKGRWRQRPFSFSCPALSSLQMGTLMKWLAGFVLCVALAFVDVWYLERLAQTKLNAAGYGESTMSTWKGHSVCPFGSLAMAFLAQGGRAHREAHGYICASNLRETTLHEVPISQPIDLDWD